MRKNRRGISYAVSAVIVTATTIILVMISSFFAYQNLGNQQGSSEFDVVQKSFQSFDDGVRDVAWDVGGIRSARFTVDYGQLELMPNDTSRGLPLVVRVVEYPTANYSTRTGYVRYSTSTNYVNYGNGYSSYLLGDSKTVVSAGTDSFGQLLVSQLSRWVNVSLTYRVRALRTSVVNVTQGGPTLVNYVDIFVIKLSTPNWSMYVHDFDLKAINLGITTITRGQYTVSGGSCTVSATLGSATSTVSIGLVSGKVVFNFIIAEVRVTT